MGKLVEIEEQGIGFKPDPTSLVKKQINILLEDLDKIIDYLKSNAFIKTYELENSNEIINLSKEATNNLGDLLEIINKTPDTMKTEPGFKKSINEGSKLVRNLKKASQYYKDPNVSEDIKSKLSEYIKQNYKKFNNEGTCGYTHNVKSGEKNTTPGGEKGLYENKTDEIISKIQQAKKLGLLNQDAIGVINQWVKHGGKESYPAIVNHLNQILGI